MNEGALLELLHRDGFHVATSTATTPNQHRTPMKFALSICIWFSQYDDGTCDSLTFWCVHLCGRDAVLFWLNVTCDKAWIFEE